MEIEDGRTDGWMTDERDGVTLIYRKEAWKRGTAEPRVTGTGENRETKERKKNKNKKQTSDCVGRGGSAGGRKAPW